MHVHVAIGNPKAHRHDIRLPFIAEPKPADECSAENVLCGARIRHLTVSTTHG